MVRLDQRRDRSDGPARRRTELSRRAVRGLVPLPELGELPGAETVELPGRGAIPVIDTGPRDAPPLFLLHALACTGLLTWYPALESLRERYRVIVFDQRWHGQGIRSRPFSLPECAHDVAAVADALGISRFLVAGYSLGSLVAQLSWRQHPQRVAGLVLCASTRNFRGTFRERLALDSYRAAVRRLPGGPARALAPGTPSTPTANDAYDWALGEFRSTSPSAIARVLAEIGRFDSSGWIDTVDVPSAVVVNTRDRMIPTRRQRLLAEHIPGATVHEVDGGHAACVLGAEPFVPALLDACATVREGAEF